VRWPTRRSAMHGRDASRHSLQLARFSTSTLRNARFPPAEGSKPRGETSLLSRNTFEKPSRPEPISRLPSRRWGAMRFVHDSAEGGPCSPHSNAGDGHSWAVPAGRTRVTQSSVSGSRAAPCCHGVTRTARMLCRVPWMGRDANACAVDRQWPVEPLTTEVIRTRAPSVTATVHAVTGVSGSDQNPVQSNAPRHLIQRSECLLPLSPEQRHPTLPPCADLRAATGTPALPPAPRFRHVFAHSVRALDLHPLRRLRPRTRRPHAAHRLLPI
jgi:hypothetical protein